jgi:hypothetical protein
MSDGFVRVIAIIEQIIPQKEGEFGLQELMDRYEDVLRALEKKRASSRAKNQCWQRGGLP